MFWLWWGNSNAFQGSDVCLSVGKVWRKKKFKKNPVQLVKKKLCLPVWKRALTGYRFIWHPRTFTLFVSVISSPSPGSGDASLYGESPSSLSFSIESIKIMKRIIIWVLPTQIKKNHTKSTSVPQYRSKLCMNVFGFEWVYVCTDLDENLDENWMKKLRTDFALTLPLLI